MYSSGSNFQRIVIALTSEDLWDDRALGAAKKEMEIRFALMLAFVAVFRADYVSWIRLFEAVSQDQNQKKKKLDEEAALLFLQRVQLPHATTDTFIQAYNFLAGNEEGWLFKNENLLRIEQAARYILQHPYKFGHLYETSSVGSSRVESGLESCIKKQIGQDVNSPKKPKLLTDAPLFSASLHLAVSKEDSLSKGLRAILPVEMHDLLSPVQFIAPFQETISLDQAMLLSLMFECVNREKNTKILNLVRTYGAYVFEEAELADRGKVTDFLKKASKAVIQERVQSILTYPEQYQHLLPLLWKPSGNTEEFVASFNEIKQRVGHEAIMSASAIVTPTRPKVVFDEIKVIHRTPTTPRREAKAEGPTKKKGQKESSADRQKKRRGKKVGKSLAEDLGSFAGESFSPSERLLPSTRVLFPGGVDVDDMARYLHEEQMPTEPPSRATPVFMLERLPERSRSAELLDESGQRSPDALSSARRSSATTPPSVVNWRREGTPQAPDDRKKFNQALDDYAAQLQIFVFMMELNLEELDSNKARDRLASRLEKTYLKVLPPPQKQGDENKKPLKSFLPVWEKFEKDFQGDSHASFLAKVKGSGGSGLFYYLGGLTQAGNTAGIGKRADEMKKYREEALLNVKVQLDTQYAQLSAELRRLHEGQALESVALTHRFADKLTQAVYDDEISLHKHGNRRLEQIKRMMNRPIACFHKWATQPASVPTLTAASQEFTEEFKQDMFNVEDEIRRDWGRKSDLRRIVREFVDPNQQFDLMAQRIAAVKAFIDTGANVPNELFIEHNYCLLDQALREALLSGEFLYDDSRIKRYLKHLNDHLPDTQISKHFMQELIYRLISEELDPFEDEMPLLKRDHAKLIHFFNGEVVIAGEVYPAIKGNNPVPAPFKELACIKIRSLLKRYLLESMAVEDMEQLRKMLSHIQAAFNLPWINTPLPDNNTSQNFSNEELDAYIQLCLKAKKVEELYRLTVNGLTVGNEPISADKIKEKIWYYLADYPIADAQEESVRQLITSIAPVFLNEELVNIRENLYKVRLVYQYGSDEQKAKLNEKFIFALNDEQNIKAFTEKFNLFLGMHSEEIDQAFSGVLWQSEKTHLKSQTCWNTLCDNLINQKVRGLSALKQHELVSTIAAHLLSDLEQEAIETRLAAIRDAKTIRAYLQEEPYWIQEPLNEEMGERADLDLSRWQTRINNIMKNARSEDKTLLVEAFTARKETLLNYPLVRSALSQNSLELLVGVGAKISSDSLACLTVLESKLPVTHHSAFQGFDLFVKQFSQKKPAYFYFTLRDLLEIANASKTDKAAILGQVEPLRSSTSNHSLHQILNLVEKVAKQDRLIFLSSVTEEMLDTLNEANHRLLTMEQEYSAALLDAITAFQNVLNNVMEKHEAHEAIRKLEDCLERDFNASAKILLKQMLTELKEKLEVRPLGLDRIKALKNKLPFDQTVKLHNIATYLGLITAHHDSSEMAYTQEGVSEEQLYNENDIKSALTLTDGDKPGLLPNAIREAIDYLLAYYQPGSYVLMGSDEEAHPHNLTERDDRDRLMRRLWLCDRVVRHYYEHLSAAEKEAIEKNRIRVELHFLRHAIHHTKGNPSRVDSHLFLLQASYPRIQDEPGKYDEFFTFRLNNRTIPACRQAYEALAAKYYCDLQAKLKRLSLDDFLSSLSQQVKDAFVEQDFLTAARLVKTFYLIKDRLEDKSRWLAVRPDFEASLLQNLNELAFVHDAKIQDLLDSKIANIVAEHGRANEILQKKALSLIVQCQSSLEFSKAMTGELERVSCNLETMQQAVFLPETPLFLAEAVRNQWLAKISSLREKSGGDAYVEFQKAIEAIIINTSDVPKLKEAVERFNEESSWAVLQERINLLSCPSLASITANKPLNRNVVSWSEKEAQAVIQEYRKQQSMGAPVWGYRFAEGLKRPEGNELITFEAYRLLIEQLKKYLTEKDVQRSLEINIALQQICQHDHVMTFVDVNKACLDQAVSHLKEPEAWIGKQIIVMLKKIALMLEKINSNPTQNFIAGLIQLRQFLSFHYAIFKQAQLQYGFKGEEAKKYEKMLKEWNARLAVLSTPFAGPLWDTFYGVMSVYPTSAQQQGQLPRSGSSIKGSSSSIPRSEVSSVASSEQTFMNSGVERLASEEDSFDIGLKMARAWESTVFLPDYPEVKLAWEQGFHNIWFEIHMILTQANEVFEGRCLDAPSPIRHAALLRLLGLCVGWEGELPGQNNLHQFMTLFSRACDYPDKAISQDVMALQDALEVYKLTPGVTLSKQAKWLYVSMHLSVLARKSVLDREDCGLFIECCHYIDASMQSLPIQKILDQMDEVGAKVPREDLWRQWPLWCANPDNPIVLKMQRLLSPPKSVRELNYLYSYLQDRRIPSDIKEWMQKQVLLVTKEPCWKEFVSQENGAFLFQLLKIAENDRSELKDWAIECFNSIQDVTEETPRALLRERLLCCLTKENHPVVEKMKALFFPPRSIEDLNFMCSCILRPDIADPIKKVMQKQILSRQAKGKDFWNDFVQQLNSPLPSLLNLAKTSKLEGQKEWAAEFLLSAKEMSGKNWLSLVDKINDDEGVMLQLLKCKILIFNEGGSDEAIEKLKAILFENSITSSRFVEQGAKLNPACQMLICSTVEEVVSLIPSLEVSTEMKGVAQNAYKGLCQAPAQSSSPYAADGSGVLIVPRASANNPYLGQITRVMDRQVGTAPIVSTH